MVSHSKVLRDRLEGQRSRIIYKDRSKQGFCQTFSTVDSARLEGYSPSMCLMDEVHAWPDNTVYNAIKTGVGARLNPLMLIITTAGSNNAGFCTEYLNYHKNVLDEKIEDDNSVGFIYQIDSFDDLSDPKNWVKSNPSIGIINSLEDLKITFNQSKYSYADKHDFCTKHLNIFVDTPDVWIPQEDVSPCFKDIDIETFKGRDCYVGMDLSKTTDLTSISFLFPPIEEDPNICIYTIFFMADRQGNIIRKNGKDMTQWIKSGYITKCDSKVIDINQIYGKIIELSNKFNIVSISYDPYNSPELVSRLKEYGLYCAPFSQTATKFNAPLKIMETKIYEGNLKFIKNPCMLWQFGNVVLYVDGNANIKIVKNKQNDSVDGIVAAAMAVGGYIEGTFGQEVMGLNAYSNIINALS
jgi:phage terminase large subunit-like protein